jgi:DNA-binding transcriptional regulator YbjK
LTRPPSTRTAVPQLTREHVVAAALTIIAEEGVQALTMRALAARLGVVTVGDLAAEYGFTDLDGSQPDAWRYLVAS